MSARASHESLGSASPIISLRKRSVTRSPSSTTSNAAAARRRPVEHVTPAFFDASAGQMEPWAPFAVEPYELLRVRKGGFRQSWLYCYALERSLVQWGGKLRVCWALDGPRGGIEVFRDGAPVIAPKGARSSYKDEPSDDETHVASEIEFDQDSYAYAERWIAEEPPERWIPRPLPNKRLLGARRAHPVHQSVGGMDGFVFIASADD